MQELINNIVRLFIENPVAQTVGFIAFFFQFLAFLNKSDRKRLMLQFAWFITWFFHYALMWLLTPAIAFLIYGLRNYISANYKPNYKITLIFIIIHTINWVLTYKDIYSILPIVWGLTGIISVFHFRWLAMRTISMIWAFMWLFYNIIEGSIWWIATITILTTANIITITRILLDRRKVKLEEAKKELEPEII